MFFLSVFFLFSETENLLQIIYENRRVLFGGLLLLSVFSFDENEKTRLIKLRKIQKQSQTKKEIGCSFKSPKTVKYNSNHKIFVITVCSFCSVCALCTVQRWPREGETIIHPFFICFYWLHPHSIHLVNYGLLCFTIVYFSLLSCILCIATHRLLDYFFLMSV